MYKNKEKRLLAAKKYRLKNKEKIKTSWKKYYSKNKDKIKTKRKTKKYKELKHQSYLRCKNHIYEYNKIYKEKHPWVSAYKAIKDRSSNSNLSLTITKKDFYEWFKNQKHKCYYCELEDLNIDFVRKVKNTKRFTIDRMNNNKGYDLNNICFACPLCNLLKNNFFSAKEWKKIAQKYIKPKWKENLNEQFL